MLSPACGQEGHVSAKLMLPRDLSNRATPPKKFVLQRRTSLDQPREFIVR
jgi:hypothetical protein